MRMTIWFGLFDGQGKAANCSKLSSSTTDEHVDSYEGGQLEWHTPKCTGLEESRKYRSMDRDTWRGGLGKVTAGEGDRRFSALPATGAEGANISHLFLSNHFSIRQGTSRELFHSASERRFW
jgi:hypothetical protein